VDVGRFKCLASQSDVSTTKTIDSIESSSNRHIDRASHAEPVIVPYATAYPALPFLIIITSFSSHQESSDLLPSFRLDIIPPLCS